jgi:asparagine synthase (glutamine-hydrolysing)
MSAIAGAISFDRSRFAVSERLVRAMLDTMRHRGPDGVGQWVASAGLAGLGHRRMASVETKSQPVSFRDETLWLAMDGSIFNRKELRVELEGAGYRCLDAQTSDAELAIRAYDRWGIDCLERFNGIFAIAIWCGRERALWLVRDRMGIKPLYYSVHNGRLSFGSEIKALLADPAQRRDVCEEGLYHYMSFNFTPAPRTMFAGIKKLSAGTWLRVGADGALREQRYWDVWEHTDPILNMADEDLLDLVMQEIERSVRWQSTAQAPVGMLLSSGWDSNVNAALLAKATDAPLRTVTYDYKFDLNNYRHESVSVRRAASLFGYENRVCDLTQDDVLRFLPRMAHFLDEPLADPNTVPFHYVSELARESGMAVSQHALGCDELFIGRPSMAALVRLQNLSDLPVPRVFKQLGLWALGLAGRAETFPYERLRRAARGEPVIWNATEMFSDAQKMRLLSPRLRQRFADFYSFEAVEKLHNRFQDKAWEKSNLHWMSYVSLHLKTPDYQMMRSDKMGMSASHEIRSPMLDHKIIELGLSLPSEVHIRGRRLKRIMEDLAVRLKVDHVVERNAANIGFPYPWLFERMGEFARAELDSFCQKTDFLDRTEVLKHVDTMQSSGNVHMARQTWCLLIFAMWWNAFVGSMARESDAEPLAGAG